MPTIERTEEAPFPERVGRYELLLPIASGGMARVYLARARGAGGFEREVALKLTHAHLRETVEFASDLVEEAKLAARIRHPNVVQVLDVADDAGGVFLVMEYVEGDTLWGLMRNAAKAGERIPVAIGLRILCDALAGLHAAHELRDANGAPLGIVHRDFTPQNILVGVDGVSRLTDFGVAKAATRISDTRTGVVKGKTSYMAPEQVRALKVDRRCDVWSAGVVAWELLSGQRLYPPNADPTAVLLQIATTEPPPLRAVWRDAPPALSDAIARALTADANARCATAEELRARLADAWAPYGGAADAQVVAEYLARQSGERLSQRREKVSQIERERAEAIAERPTRSAITTIDPVVPTDRSTQGSVVTANAALPLAERASRARWLAGVVAALAVAGVAALVFTARARGVANPFASAPSPVQAPAPPPSPPVASPPAPPASATTSANNEAASAPATQRLTLVANAAIAKVEVNGRAVESGAPAREVTVDVAGDAIARGLRVRAVAIDGRERIADVPAGQARAEIAFAPALRPGALPARPQGDKPAATGAKPLAESPYE